MDDQEEFERQLALEQKETRKQEQGHVYTDPSDGTVYEWDEEKQAWFPRVDEDFLAAYHANYGVYPTPEGDQTTSTTPATTTVPTSTTTPDKPAQRKRKPKQNSGDEVSVEESLMRAQREAEQGIPAPVLDESIAAADAEHLKSGKRKKEEPTWFEMEDSKNTNVYVSGLPTEDFTENDFVELMSKYGIIMVDEENDDAPKVKLYRDVEGQLKGDGRCCYLKLESVRLAIQLLDDSEYQKKKIHVERAQFALKGDFNPQMKKKKKKPNKKKKAGQKNFKPQDKLLDWRPEKEKKKKRFEQVVIIKHVFHPNEFEEDAMLINEIKDDLEAECKNYGEVKKVMIFDRHPDGVASVKFKDGDAADVCVLALNGRWFAQRQLEAEIWDGKTDYKVEETDMERDERIKKWQEFLENEDENKDETTEDKEAKEDKDNTKEDKDNTQNKDKTTEDKESTQDKDSTQEKKDNETQISLRVDTESGIEDQVKENNVVISEVVSGSEDSSKKKETDDKMSTENDRTDENKTGNAQVSADDTVEDMVQQQTPS